MSQQNLNQIVSCTLYACLVVERSCRLCAGGLWCFIVHTLNLGCFWLLYGCQLWLHSQKGSLVQTFNGLMNLGNKLVHEGAET